jgi:RNA polymerase sigma factor (sigma-70 family)
MSIVDSVTEWISKLKTGDPHASQQLWERYVDRLLQHARKKLHGAPRRAADEEDVVLSAFRGFFQGVEQRRFPQLDDRDDLWQVLVMLTERRVIDHWRREKAEKRGAGRVQQENAPSDDRASDEVRPALDDLIANEPTPEFAAQFAEQMELLLKSLADPTLRRIAIAKMEGYTNQKLADELKMTTRSIERKLSLIRQAWQKGHEL